MDRNEENSEILQGNDFAQLVYITEAASNLCCDLALKAGEKIESFARGEIDYETATAFYDTLGEAIETNTGLVYEIWLLYCKYPYYTKRLEEEEARAQEYERQGVAPDYVKKLKDLNKGLEDHIKEQKNTCRESLESLRAQLVEIQAHYHLDFPLPYDDFLNIDF